jgi:type I restriction enzyme S subunit
MNSTSVSGMIHTSEVLPSGHLPSSENSSSQTTGWKRLKFGDVCKVQGGFAFKSQEYEKSGIPLVRISNLVNGKVSFDSDPVYLPTSKLEVHKEFVLKRGDTLIAMSGATTGKMATYDMDSPALLNQRVGRFRILSEESSNPRFISLLVQQITRRVLKEAYGPAQPNISPSQIEQIPIPFPPLEEQKAIVAEIEKQFTRLEAGVAGLRRVRANLKRYRAAVLKGACEGKLVPTEAQLARQEGRGYETGAQLLERILTERRQKWNGKGKYKEPTPPNLTTNEDLPDGWTWASCEQVAFFQNGRPFPSAQYAEKGFKLLRPGNLYVSGKVGWNEDNTRYMPHRFADENPDLIVRGRELIMDLTAQSLKGRVPGPCVPNEGARRMFTKPTSRATQSDRNLP